MIDDIIVIDDVISSSKQDFFEDLFTSQKLAWLFFKDIALPPSEIKRLGITELTPGIACYIKQDNPKFINDNLLREVKIIKTANTAWYYGDLEEVLDADTKHFDEIVWVLQ